MRVALADDSALFRRGLGLLLEQAGVDVVVSVDSGVELERALAPVQGRCLGVDVAVLDIRMPPTHTDEGLTTAEALRRARPDLGILVLSTYVEAAYAIRLLTAHPHGVGYLLKDRVDDVATLVDGLRRIAAGGSVVDPEVLHRLVRSSAGTPLSTLTGREREALSLIAEGRSNASIADAMHVSEKTLEGYVAVTFAKLGLLPEPGSNRRVLAVLQYLSS